MTADYVNLEGLYLESMDAGFFHGLGPGTKGVRIYPRYPDAVAGSGPDPTVGGMSFRSSHGRNGDLYVNSANRTCTDEEVREAADDCRLAPLHRRRRWRVPEGLLAPFRSTVEEVRLQQMNSATLPQTLLDQMPRLTMVEFSGNAFEHLPAKMFQGSPSEPPPPHHHHHHHHKHMHTHT